MNREESNIKMAVTGMIRNNHPILPPKKIIEKAINDFKENLVLGWSGGRCSTVVLNMALEIDGNIKVIYTDTGIEFLENVEYVNEVADLWGVNLTTLKPDTTFWEIVDKWGMPQFRRFGASPKLKREELYGKRVPRRPMCCFYLKEKPRYEYYRENDIMADLTGLRACESRIRAMLINQRGMFYTVTKPKNFTTHHPIAIWSTPRMEKYLEKHKIPHNKVYDTQTRNGCWACTAYKGWEKNIMKYNPRMYKFLQSKKGVMLMDDYIPNLTPCEDLELCE